MSYPTGNVTFLFTDIEGSTARWESHRDEMQQALRLHDAILQRSIQAHGGYVFKTIGDAFCAAFADPQEAVYAALDAQRAIAAENWDTIGGLRVRMAIHSGETDERDGDYFGQPVNRVARLLSAGHGGQVLVSGIVSDAIGARLSDGVSLRHLGTLPLRDLKEPERVHELIAPGFPSIAKALRSLETPPNNLPRQTTAFVGRRDDAMHVAELLRHSALVTIVGAGGIGKTRLALEVAASLLNGSSDGAWFVDLASLTDPALVAGTILATFDVPLAGEMPALEQLVAYLKTRNLILVLDNGEHLIDEVATITGAIVARCQDVAILATSREAIAIAAERVYHLATLDSVASAELFADRARLANPRFTIDDGNRAAVEDICRRLDGIALGIELAAARVRTMPVAELAKHLELRMLSRGGRDKSARQQTMNALVGWSYELLSDEEKALFRRLSVFAGGMTLAAVTESEELDRWSVLDLLTSLAEKSLLIAEPPEAPLRYRMLEPIREYARERLEENGETHQAQSQHARAFARLTDVAYEEWDTKPAPDWLKRQENELDNIRAALHWSLRGGSDELLGARIAGSAGPVFLRLSLFNEGVYWGELALARRRNVCPEVEARLHYALSMLFNNLLSYAPALAHAESAAELYEFAGDERGRVRALSQVAQQKVNNGDGSSGQRFASRAITLGRGLGDEALLASVLARCTNIADVTDIETARDRYRESVSLFRGLGRDEDAARVLEWWASTEAVNGELSEAARIIEEALPLATGEIALWVTSAAAAIYWALDDGDRAVPITRTALRLAAGMSHPVLLPFMISYVALIANKRDPEEACRLLGYADQSQRSGGHSSSLIEQSTFERLRAELRGRLTQAEISEAIAEGATWSDEQACARAQRV
jgi:predicted ATPase/class 3 adenylate cyclase